ncbi:mechanosensitive ion channel [Simiduia curdlanivorans]|uniref:Mechanosensitive ion channel domain-containing protein n=1 Tax=Simiduia curdlanivorans TaxID=1492769 RepID=A0ABV8V6A3_9GAMM|nr:mechanosensitive ion channel domain-containing protein [Simiduia curdlanivorans]MDN3638734.1 mechanosensitive ion channel [Simiduia curdlanivorans]
MDAIQWILPELSHTQWLVHSLIFLTNVALLIFARPLLQMVQAGIDSDTRIKVFRALNILVLVLHVLDLALIRTNVGYENYFINVGLSLMAIYGGLFVNSLASYFSRKRFGHQKVLDGKKIFLDTYSSRLVDLLLLMVITLTTLYVIIKIWGADSLLETTGIFGILIAFLAFTSSIWAPDIISGLIILNTEILEDGDVVVIDRHPDEYVISKVTLIYVILYDIRNNHRTLIRNSQFTQSKIDNLSRIASTDGIRQPLTYKIGYPGITGTSAKEKTEHLNIFKNKIDQLFRQAFEACASNKDVKINNNKMFEWALTSAGDYALEYTLWFYLERIPNTKHTSTLRKHLMGTAYRVNEAVYTASVIADISLATPALLEAQVRSEG